MPNTQSQTSQVDQMAKYAQALLSQGNLPFDPANVNVLVAQQQVEGEYDPTTLANVESGKWFGGGLTNPFNVVNTYDPATGKMVIRPAPSQQVGIQQTLAAMQNQYNDPYFQSLKGSANETTSQAETDELKALGQSGWEGLPPGSLANQQYAAQVGSALTGYTPVKGKVSPAVSGGKTSQYDFFTQAMITLNGYMNPSSPSILSVLSLNVGPTLTMIFSRGAFALGFTGLAAAGALGVISGGLGGVPGLVAAFIAGPEIGAAHVLSKMGINKGGANEADNARIELARQRQALSESREARLASQKQMTIDQSAKRLLLTQQHEQRSHAQAQQRISLAQAREARLKAARQNNTSSNPRSGSHFGTSPRSGSHFGTSPRSGSHFVEP